MSCRTQTASKDRANPPEGGSRARVVLVTGMSGAGKTTALKALEDMDYEAVDNVPLSLLNSLVEPVRRGAPDFRRPIAIGVDIRTRDFGVKPFLDAIDSLRAGDGVDVRVLFLDCDDVVLIRRYEETRRRHPLAGDRPVPDGIDHERTLVAPLLDLADLVVDTSELAPGALKHILQGHLGHSTELTIFVTSFSYRHGLPRMADLVFDVRFLANPYYRPELKDLDGRDPAVADFISSDGGFGQFFDGVTGLLEPLLPRYVEEGKSYLTIAVGCTGGRHRSVFVAERLARWLEALGRTVQVRHRDLAE